SGFSPSGRGAADLPPPLSGRAACLARPSDPHEGEGDWGFASTAALSFPGTDIAGDVLAAAEASSLSLPPWGERSGVGAAFLAVSFGAPPSFTFPSPCTFRRMSGEPTGTVSPTSAPSQITSPSTGE